MSDWKYTCNGFKPIRKLLYEYREAETIPADVCKKILRGLQRSIKEIARLFLHDVTLYDYWIEELQEEIEYIEDIQSDIDGEAEDTVNYRLAEFYEFCDDLRIWLPI